MHFVDENLDFEPIRIEKESLSLGVDPGHPVISMIPRPIISDDDNEWKPNEESNISARGTVFKKGYSILLGFERGFRVLTPGHIRQCCKSWLVPDWAYPV